MRSSPDLTSTTETQGRSMNGSFGRLCAHRDNTTVHVAAMSKVGERFAGDSFIIAQEIRHAESMTLMFDAKL